jgi:transcriptional regulator with XRE-family HTH domain
LTLANFVDALATGEYGGFCSKGFKTLELPLANKIEEWHTMNAKTVTAGRSAKRKLKAPKAPNVDELAKQLGQRIRTIREAQGLQQQELAHRLGWGKDRVCRIENGTRRLAALDKARICAVFNVSEAQLDATEVGSKTLPARYAALPVIDRHKVAKLKKGFALLPIATQSLCMDWFPKHVKGESLTIVATEREDEGLSDAEFVVVDTSTTEVAQRGTYLLWVFGRVAINKCEPDLATGKVTVSQGPKSDPAIFKPGTLEVIGRVVGAWRHV